MAVAAAIGLAVGLFLRGTQRFQAPSSANDAIREVEASEPSGKAALARPLPTPLRTPAQASAPEASQGLEPRPPSTRPTLRDAFAALDEAVLSDTGLLLPEDWFEEKYSGLSITEMKIAEVALKAKMQAESDRLTAELFEQGRFETQIVPEDQVAAMPQATHDEPVVSIGFQIVPDDGFSTVNVAKIDPKEYPEFDSLRCEWRWLASYIKRQEGQRAEEH